MKDIFESTKELCEELKEYPEDDVLRAEAEGIKKVFLAWKEKIKFKLVQIANMTDDSSKKDKSSWHWADLLIIRDELYEDTEKIDAAIKEIQEALK